jgi:hypothetical protein
MVMEMKFGWIKDKYNPKAVYRAPKAVKIADAVNWLSLCPDVRDQGKEGSCTGFGISALAYTVAKAGNFQTSIYSPQWLYNGARFIEGTLAQDVGASPEDVFAWALQNGLLFEEYWPYHDVPFDMSAPSSLRDSQAIHYPGIQAIRVDNGLEGILQALNDGHCVAIGAPWAVEWENGKQTILPLPKAVDGGHETLYYGYDKTAGYLNCQNSWGIGWGNLGRCRIPFEAIDWWKANGGYDAHYFEFSNTPVPPPVPPVPPKTCCPVLKLLAIKRKEGGK